MVKRVGNKIGWVLTLILGIGLIISGLFVAMGGDFVNQTYAAYGLSHVQLVIGLGKIVTAILFLIPATFMIGVLLMSAFFGGAIVTHMTVQEPFLMQSILLILVWVILWLRRPGIFRR